MKILLSRFGHRGGKKKRLQANKYRGNPCRLQQHT